MRIWFRIGEDNVSLISAGVALYAMLAVFPALFAVVSLYGLLALPGDISEHLDGLRGVFPAAGVDLLQSHLVEVASQPATRLNFGIVVSGVVTLWSANRGMNALLLACGTTYRERDARSFLGRMALSLLFTVGAIVTMVAIAGLILVLPLLLELLPFDGLVQMLINALRWVVLWLLMAGGLMVLYRLAPHRALAKWRWTRWGALAASTLWLIGSLLFSWYVQSFGNYSDTYGALGSVVILLLWFNLSALVIVLGAELNAELELQTAQDTTRGPDKPMGARGAFVADHVGRPADGSAPADE